MKRNQFLDCNDLILEASAKTKRKAGYIKIAMPEETIKKMIKQIALNEISPILGLQLCWYDEDVKEVT